MKANCVAALCVAGALALAGQASAAAMIATYVGGTNRFNDNSGLFGFVYDDETFGHGSIGWTAVFNYGGASDEATFTMNGHTIHIGGVGFAARNGFYDVFNSQSDGVTSLSIGLSLPVGVVTPNDLFTPMNGFASGGCLQGGFSSGQTGGNLCPHSVTVAFADAQIPVPEPAAWALMILGFGALGCALRLGRRVRPVAGQ